MHRTWRPEKVADDLWVVQPRPGYRFSTDPFLLGGWVVEGGLPGRVLDVGTGSGVLGLMLARMGAHVHGVDVQHEWAPHVQKSTRLSGLLERFTFEYADIRSWTGTAVDLVVSNPPYFSLGTGHLPPDPLRAAARHALQGDLVELLPAMAQWAPRVAVVLPISREAEARTLLREAGKPVVRSLRLLPRLVLLEGQRGGGDEVAECAPLRDGDAPSCRVAELYARVRVPLAGIQTGASARNAIHHPERNSRLEDVRESMEVARAKEHAKSRAAPHER